MGLAEDMGRLRRGVEELRTARIALKRRLSRFASDLRQNMNQTRTAMRREQAETARTFRNSLSSFVSCCKQTTRETLGAYRKERVAARDAWFQGRHGRRSGCSTRGTAATEASASRP